MSNEELRKDALLPLDWLIDVSRNPRGGQGWNESVEVFLDGLIERIPRMYSLNLLADHEFSIQVWLEKEALIGVIERTINKWDVPLLPAKGYSSLSFLKDAASSLEYKDRPAKIFHFGDYDPSGQNAIETVQRDLPRLAPKTARHGIEFNVVAVLPRHIEEMNLPTRLTNKDDPRAEKFGSDVSVELDAIEPNVLRQMVDEVLQPCFPPGAIETLELHQEAGREQIRQWLARRMRT